MPTDLPKDITVYYFTQGILGVTCLVLALVVAYLWRTLNAERATCKADAAAKDAAHKIEIAAKDALIEELHDDVLKEARSGFELSRSTTSTLDAVLSALRGKAPA